MAKKRYRFNRIFVFAQLRRLRRLKRPQYTLEELLAGVTKENRHEEIDFGSPVGRERWWEDEPDA